MEYTKLIDTIMATEQAAQQITQDAKYKSTSLEPELVQESAKLRENYMNRAKRKVAAVEDETAKQTAQNIAALDKKLASTLAAVEHAKQKYHENWVDTLFHMIVGDQFAGKPGGQS